VAVPPRAPSVAAGFVVRRSSARASAATSSSRARFSKKWDNLDAALALHFAYYNFCRVHKSIKMTPAMAPGLTDRVWTIAELLG
jgi:hypothetical protein